MYIIIIWYLAPNYIMGLHHTKEGDRGAWEHEIINHGNVKSFSPEEFEVAFNNDEISDQGWIVMDIDHNRD